MYWLTQAGSAPPTPRRTLRQADLVLLVMGTSLLAVAASRARLAVLREELAVTSGADTVLAGVGLLLQGAAMAAGGGPGGEGGPTPGVRSPAHSGCRSLRSSPGTSQRRSTGGRGHLGPALRR